MLFGLGLTAVAQEPTCATADGRNGSALCVQLAIDSGQLKAAAFTFSPTSAYKPSSGQAFFQLAQAEISKLAKPCQPLLAQGAKPAPAFCTGSSQWPAFAQQYQTLAESLDRPSLLSDAGIFRPLLTAHFRVPLLYVETNGESGIAKFHIPDPIDPRTATTFQIEIRGTPDAARRIVELRQFLNPLRGQVFCHSRIRARVQAFYKKRKISVEILQLDPQGPLLILQEKP
ncbi:MAG: hypothetical protein JNM66_21640 [Bryobacterales bacterium]|nr:hypothetical protein [Bryobacterales bacterium]